MKLSKIPNALAIGLALTLTTLGCRTHSLTLNTPPADRPQPIHAHPGNPAPAVVFTPREQPRAIEPANAGIPPNPNGSHTGWIEDRFSLQQQIVYFDFDKSAIKSAGHAKLENVAHYLQSNAGAAIRIEGNCDERGTEEYNRSLGERRALSSREYLVRLGIESGRIDTLSNGEDKPAEAGHEKGAWAKNRRDEFVVLTPPKIL